MWCPKSRFPNWIIVFDELELIIFVSQGLTLSTASLVHVIYKWIIKLYLDIVDEVQEDLHNAGEDHQACAGDKKDVDVFKWLILLFFGSCKPL